MILDSFKTYLKRIRSGVRLDPMRDWLVLVALSAMALAGIIVWNVWAFDTVADDGVIGGQTPSSSQFFNQSPIDRIHTIFTNRAEEELKYQTGVYRFNDPSQ